jgi:hypothetical protein
MLDIFMLIIVGIGIFIRLIEDAIREARERKLAEKRWREISKRKYW